VGHVGSHLIEVPDLSDHGFELLLHAGFGAAAIDTEAQPDGADARGQRRGPTAQRVHDRAHRNDRGANRLRAVGADDAAHGPTFEIWTCVAAELLDIVERVLDLARYRAVVAW